MTISDLMSGFRSMTIQSGRRTDLMRKIEQADTVGMAWNDTGRDLRKALNAQPKKPRKSSTRP